MAKPRTKRPARPKPPEAEVTPITTVSGDEKPTRALPPLEEPFPFRPPECNAFPPFLHYTGENRMLSPPECDAIIKLGEECPLALGGVGNATNNDYRTDIGYRYAKTRALWPKGDNLLWLYQRLREKIMWANQDYYRFNLTGLGEAIQFLRYDAPEGDNPGGHYNWHQDFGGGYSSNRKLTIVIQLSDPKDYEGGRLSMFADGEYEIPHAEQGDAVMFISWQPHKVSTVTKGRRYSLAIWVSGPQFQ